MTAKQKADELIKKVKKATTYKYQEYAGANYSTFEHDIEELKNVALIMVDEIIATQPSYPSDVDWDDVGATHQYFYEAQREEAEAFWLRVKSELNAL